MSHQRITDRLAPIGPSSDEFERAIGQAARQLLNAGPLMSSTEKQLLWDLQRGRNLVVLGRVADVSRRCGDFTAAVAIAEAFRGYVLAGNPRLATNSVFDAFQWETRVNGPADVAQVDFLIAPSRATRERAIETLVAQATATRAAIDALHRGETTQGQRLALVG